MRVTVTQDDIDNGIRHSPSFCPIGRAFKRSFPGHFDVSVANPTIVYHYDDMFAYFRPSKRALAFMTKFDEGENVEPTSFNFPEAETRFDATL